MRNRIPHLAAISREMEFIAAHEQDADDVYDGKLSVDPVTLDLVKVVYDRANQDAQAFLRATVSAVSVSTKGQIRIRWPKRASPFKWHRESPVSMPRGHWRRIGWAGVGLDLSGSRNPIRVVSWVHPLGGLDGRRELAEACKKKLSGVELVSDDPAKWPEWTDTVIYDTRSIRRSTSRDDVLKAVGQAAHRFYRVATPVLHSISRR